MTRYLGLAEFFWLAEQVTGLDTTILVKASRVELADSALHAPQAGYGDEDFYPDIYDRAAVLTCRPAWNHQIKRELVAIGRAHPDAVVHGFPIAGLTAATLSDLAWIELAEGRVASARSDAHEALTLRRNHGHPHGIAHALMAVAGVAIHLLALATRRAASVV